MNHGVGWVFKVYTVHSLGETFNLEQSQKARFFSRHLRGAGWELESCQKVMRGEQTGALPLLYTVYGTECKKACGSYTRISSAQS